MVHLRSTLLCTALTLSSTLAAALPLIPDSPSLGMNDAAFTEPYQVEVDSDIVKVTVDRRLINDAMFTSPHPVDLDAGIAQVKVDRRLLNDAMWTSSHRVEVDSPVAPLAGAAIGSRQMNDAAFTEPYHVEVDADLVKVNVDRRLINDAMWTSHHQVEADVPDVAELSVERDLPSDARFGALLPMLVEEPLGKRQDDYPGESYAPHSDDEYESSSSGGVVEGGAPSVADNGDYPGESYAPRQLEMQDEFESQGVDEDRR